MALALVIAFSGVGDGTDTPERSSVAAASVGAPSVSPKCTARAAVRFYSRRIADHVDRSRALVPEIRVRRNPTDNGCPRYLARVLQAKAYALRVRVDRLLEHHFAWWKWLPDKWQRIGACETGYGRRPGSWTWDSGLYVSAFGIYRAGYADDAHRIGGLSWDETLARLHRFPTPREQYEAALSHYRAHGGFSGWGCRGA